MIMNRGETADTGINFKFAHGNQELHLLTVQSLLSIKHLAFLPQASRAYFFRRLFKTEASAEQQALA
jgi:hypothetical protein